MATTPDISLIVPAYNEEKRIGPCLRELARFLEEEDRSYEVIVVDDGSRDRTAEIVTYFIEEFVPDGSFRLLRYEENRGKGFAVKRGLQSSTGRYVAFTDTDLSAPIDQITKLLSALEAGADLAIASRKCKESIVVGLPWSRRVMSWGFSIISRWLVLPEFRDTQCGFKAYQKQAADVLTSHQTIDGFTFDVEHLFLAKKFGLKISEVPVKWIYTEGSQIRGMVDSIRMLGDLMTLRRLHRAGADRSRENSTDPD